MKKHLLLLAILILALLSTIHMSNKTAEECIAHKGAQQCETSEAPYMSTVLYTLAALPIGIALLAESGYIVYLSFKRKK